MKYREEGVVFANVKETEITNDEGYIESHLICPAFNMCGRHYLYDNQTGTIKFIDKLPYDFNGGALLSYNNEIHIIGGGATVPVNSKSGFNHYKWAGGKWIGINDELPKTIKLENCTGFIYLDQMHIIGGSSYYMTHLIYDGSKWEEKEIDLPLINGDMELSSYFDDINYCFYIRAIDDDKMYVYKYDLDLHTFETVSLDNIDSKRHHNL